MITPRACLCLLSAALSACLPGSPASLPLAAARPVSDLKLPGADSARLPAGRDVSVVDLEAAASLTALDPHAGSLVSSAAQRSAAESLANALRHHSGLTSLCLDAFADSKSMRALAPAIATLTSLRVLSLGKIGGIAVNAFPDLKMMLPPLQRLQQLKLRFLSLPADAQPRKCGREDDDRPSAGLARGSTSDSEPGEEVELCLSSLLSASTALTSLDVTDAEGERRLSAAQPLRLPCLQHLKLVSRQNAACALLAALDAPVTAVSLREPFLRRASSDAFQFKHGPHDWPCPLQLWGTLQRFKQLESVAIKVHFACSQASVVEARLSEPPPEAACLTRFAEFSLTEGLAAQLCFAEQLSDSSVAAAVQRLNIHCTQGFDESAAAESWHKFNLCISRLRALRHLRIFTDVKALEPDPAGLAALRPLTQLTALHVLRWRSCLRTPDDCEALAGMRQLRSLCLESVAMATAIHSDCVRALGALPSLSEFALSIDQDDHDVIASFQAAFVQRAPAAPWPALEWLAMFVLTAEDGDAIVQAVAAFPCLTELCLEQYFTARRPLVDLTWSPTVGSLRVADRVSLERFEWQSDWLQNN